MAQDEKKSSSGALLSVALIGGGILAVGTICWFAYRSIGQNTKTDSLLEGKSESSGSTRSNKTPVRQAVGNGRNGSSRKGSEFGGSDNREIYVSSDDDDDDDDDEEEACDKETFMRVLRDIYKGMEHVVMNLDQLQERLHKDGVDDYKISDQLNESYEKAVDEVQKSSFQKFDTTASSMEKASLFYEKDPEVLEITNKMKKLTAAITGASPQLDKAQLEKIPSDFTIDKLIKLLRAMMNNMISSRREAIEELQKELGREIVPKSLVDERFAPKIEKFKEEIFNTYHPPMDEDLLQLATQKYWEDRKLQEFFKDLSRQQEEEFEKMNELVDPDT